MISMLSCFKPKVVLLGGSSVTYPLLTPIRSRRNYASNGVKRALIQEVKCWKKTTPDVVTSSGQSRAYWRTLFANPSRQCTPANEVFTLSYTHMFCPHCSPQNFSDAPHTSGYIILGPWHTLLHPLIFMWPALTVTYPAQGGIHIHPLVHQCGKWTVLYCGRNLLGLIYHNIMSG